MPAVAPEDRITQSTTELHIGLEVPTATARQIHRWAQSQPWPEGTELDPPRDYHVTLLYTPEGYDDHKDAWWIDHMDEIEVDVSGFANFSQTQDGSQAYVLLLDSDEVKEHADMLQARAEAIGLPITHFDGGYKPHITVGYGPTRARGIKAPDFRFHVGPSSVSTPRPTEHESSLRDVMDRDTDYGDIWVDDRAKKVYLNVGDAFGDIIDEARDEAEYEYPGYEVEVLDEGARPAHTRVAAQGQLHYNTHTGLLCNCAWGAPKPRRGRQKRTAGVEARKILKAPDKAWKTPAGAAFRDYLGNSLSEDHDALIPYLANRYKRGDVRLMNYGRPEIPGQALRYVSDFEGPASVRNDRGHWEFPAGPVKPVWRDLDPRLGRWNQWYQARQHPLRRGVNILDKDFSPMRMEEMVSQHQQALQLERQRQRWLENYGQYANPEHVFGPELFHHYQDMYGDPENPEATQQEASNFAKKYQGWQVVPLDAHQAEGDSEALGHCIGNPNYPYYHAIDRGDINAYSLRDPEGYPHVSWHINPSGDDIGHMQGKSGNPKQEHRDLISAFNNQYDYPDDEGSEEELEPAYDQTFTFPRAQDVEDYNRWHGPEPDYDYAYENGNIGENTEFDWETPDWNGIAGDYLGGYGDEHFFNSLRNNGTPHWRHMADAMREEFNPEDETHREMAHMWNQEVPSYEHEIEMPADDPEEVEDYNDIVNEGREPEPTDWDTLGRDYLENADPTNPNYQRFHQNLLLHGHEHDMRDALLRNADWEDPQHQTSVTHWNYGMPRNNIHPPEPEVDESQPGWQTAWQWPPRHRWPEGNNYDWNQTFMPYHGWDPEMHQRQYFPSVQEPGEEPSQSYPEQKRWVWPRGMFSPNYIPPEEGINWNYPNEPGTFSRVAYDPNAEILDHLSLRSIAAQLHYRYEQTGSLNSQEAVDYAKRVLQLVGYPTDTITVQAAIQAWQQEHPEDKVILEGGQVQPLAEPPAGGYNEQNAQVQAIRGDQEGRQAFSQGLRRSESQTLAQGNEEAQVEFPSVQETQEIHDQAVADHGQPYAALPDPGKLEGALGRAANHYYYGEGAPGERIASAAGALAHGIGMSQAFVDGNKKTAYHTTRYFLHNNGYGHLSPFDYDDDEFANHLVGHGEGTHSLEDTQGLFRSRLPRVSVQRKKFAPDAEELSQSLGLKNTVPSEVNDPEDHWPEWGERPPDRKVDPQIGNEWVWTN